MMPLFDDVFYSETLAMQPLDLIQAYSGRFFADLAGADR
jgi:hypothetical protein